MTTKKPISKNQSSCADDVDVGAISATEAMRRINALIELARGSKRVDIANVVDTVEIKGALGRVLAEDVISGINVPPHTNSAMDGYAFSADLLPTKRPVELKVIGSAYAGKVFADKVNAGQCVRIMTGAMMPPGTDTVIMQEQVALEGDFISFNKDFQPGQNVRKAGEDLSAGQVALAAGKKIMPADLGLLASLGVERVKLRPHLRVAFFSTGDELRSLCEPLAEGEIYDSNRYTLFGMLSRLPLQFVDMGVVPDEPVKLRQTLTQAAEAADVVITSGGVSVGEADYIKDILAELGGVDFWKIAIKPGRPLACGTINNKLFFGLPGNPVAVMVTFYQFVQPALRLLMGQNLIYPLRFKVACLSEIRKKPGRMEFYRGILQYDEQGNLTVRSTGKQGSGILKSMSEANCFIVLAPESGSINSGDIVEVELFEGLM